MTAFEEMGVMPEISAAVEEMDWSLPTDIQAEGIPLILGGGDVLMAAETGSGKTGAFCLPVIQIVYETLRDLKEGKCGKVIKGSNKVNLGNKWRMNVHDRGNAMAIDTNEGLLCQSRDPQGWHGCRATQGVSGGGKYYYEATVTDEGLCRVGWSTGKASLDLGTDVEGFGFGGTGKKSNCRQFDTYGEPYGLNDTIGCYLDLNHYIIKWSKNGIDFGKAYDLTNHLKNAVFYPTVCLKNAEIKFNFGESKFAYPSQGDYTALCRSESRYVVKASTSGSSIAGPKSIPPNAPLALIIEPSRELADQIHTQINQFKKNLNPSIHNVLLVGGVSAKEQIDSLNSGVHIVSGTPGRVEDLISSEKMDLSCIRFFILDECDGLLSAGYGKMIENIHKLIPKVSSEGTRLQMIVCSATLHSFDVKKMAEKLMQFPTWIDLKGQDSVPETVHHVVLPVDPSADSSWMNMSNCIATDGVHKKDRLNPSVQTPEMLSEAVKMLKGEYTVRAINKLKMDKAIIFCRTKIDCDNMEAYLNSRGGGKGRNHNLSCVVLHGDRKPAERKGNLETFKRGDVKFLVCTDVAARGIDVSRVPYVINVTLPDEKENYVHRIGRVGRADRMGLAISFSATCKEKVWYHSNCNNRGRGCFNTSLTEKGGCCIWYNEPQYLGNIEEHLGVTVDQCDLEMNISVNQFDGKVVYGQKRKDTGSGYKGHVEVLAPAVKELHMLEKNAQSSFINLIHQNPFTKKKK